MPKTLNQQILTVLKTNNKGFDFKAKADVIEKIVKEWYKDNKI